MLIMTVYCLLELKPEDVSGFADFEKQLNKGRVKLKVLDFETFEEELPRIIEEKNGVLVTDRKIEADVPVAGFLTEKNNYSLSYKYLFESFDGLTLAYLDMVYSRFYGVPLEILETDRLRVREMTIDDLDRLYEIYEEPSITEYMEGLYPDKKDELEFTKSYIENMYGFYGYGLWIVIEKLSGKIIGRAGLGNRELNGETYLELGYLIEKNSQRKGYATEVGLAILDYAVRELEASQVISLIRQGNEASIRTAKKLGFKEVCEVVCGEKDKYLEFLKELK